MTARAGRFFLLAACAVLDDYGVSVDEGMQRRIAKINLRHAISEAELRFDDDTPNDTRPISNRPTHLLFVMCGYPRCASIFFPAKEYVPPSHTLSRE